MNAHDRPACITARVMIARWSLKVGFCTTRGIRSTGVGTFGTRTAGAAFAAGFFETVFGAPVGLGADPRVVLGLGMVKRSVGFAAGGGHHDTP